MKRTAIKFLLAGALATTAGIASAGGTHLITVSASVTGVCKIVDATSTLAFGALNPATGGTVNAVWSGANDISFAVTGQTLIADYQNANVGSYADTVTLTVAP